MELIQLAGSDVVDDDLPKSMPSVKGGTKDSWPNYNTTNHSSALGHITVLTQGRGILPHFLMKFVLGQFHTCLQGIITTYLQYSYSSFTLIISSPPRMSLSHIYASSFVLEPIAF